MTAPKSQEGNAAAKNRSQFRWKIMSIDSSE